MIQSPTSATPSAPPLLVLLADRDDDTRLSYGEYFRQIHANIDLDEARDGREALATALARPHDLVVTETRLAGISGYELCELLRRDVATRATPIVVITGEASATTVERARAAGADAVLLKPCLPDVLLAEMRRLLQRSVELREHAKELRSRT